MRLRTLLVLGCTAATLAGSGPGALASTDPRSQWDHLVGWYRLGDGREVLLTWAADGDLRLAAPGEPYFSHPFRLQPDGSFLWRHTEGGTEEERTARFSPARSGAGFVWTSQGGGMGFVPRLEPQPYALHELAFRNRRVRLSGTLLAPEGDEPVPGAVMIHGSGDSDRDNLWYLAIADHLARSGIAVLLPDKRGSGRSEGDWRTSSMEDFARDATAAIEAAREHDGVAPSRIGLVGVSQGGSIAPLAASMTPDCAFVVSLVAGVATFDQILLHESRQTLRQNGLPGFLADGLAPMAAAIAKRRRPVWWRLNGDFDPLPHWRRLTVPKLFVFGADDERDNVPVSRSVSRLEEADLRDVTIQIYRDSGHALFSPGTETIRPDVLELLATWIERSSRVPFPR